MEYRQLSMLLVFTDTTHSQAGLLATGSFSSHAFPSRLFGTVAHVGSSPVTAAGPLLIYTGFPIKSCVT